MQPRVDVVTFASVGLAVIVFIVDLLWLFERLPMPSDSGQIISHALTGAWALITLVALWRRPNWLLALSAFFALIVPIAFIGLMAASCSLYHDCP